MVTKYRADIDGLRALAVLAVIFFHADLGCSGGFVGVDIFFVISGFLITSLILQGLREESFSLRTFWERRIRRIFPAMLVVVLATLAAGWYLYLPKDFASLAKSVMAQAVLISNFFFYTQLGYFQHDTGTMPLLHTWSLAVEEQFYALFPLLLIFLARHKRFSISRTIAYLALASFVLCVVGSYTKAWATFYLLPTRAWELMTGAYLAAVSAKPWAARWLNESAGLLGLGLILFSVFFYTRQTRFPGWAAIPPCLGAALIILTGGKKPTLVAKLLMLRPVVFIGLISYSLYLWHWPLLVFSRYIHFEPQSWGVRLALLAASLALAVLSFQFIETPFRLRWIFPRRPQVFALAGFATMGLLLFGGVVLLSQGVPSRLNAEALHYVAARDDFPDREVTMQQAAAGQFIELGAQNTNQPIEFLIWGDSHAMALAPVLDELCRKYSVRGVQATHTATPPFLESDGFATFSLENNALPYSKNVLDFIAQKHIKTVILAAYWSAYGPPDSIDTKLAHTISALLPTGARVYVVKDVPLPGFDVPRFAAFTALYHGDLAKLAIPQEKVSAADHDFEIISQHVCKLGASILDTTPYFLNTNGGYEVVRHGSALYWDSNHLTVEGSKELKPMFEPLFRGKLMQSRQVSFSAGHPGGTPAHGP